MLNVRQIAAFSDELQKIANMGPQATQAITSMPAPPPTALGITRPKAVKADSSKANAYARPVNVPATSPAVGVQPVSNPPSVRS